MTYWDVISKTLPSQIIHVMVIFSHNLYNSNILHVVLDNRWQIS